MMQMLVTGAIAVGLIILVSAIAAIWNSKYEDVE
jgi:hypothetical protein